MPGRVFLMTLTIDPLDARWRRFRAAALRPTPGRLHNAGMHSGDWESYWSEQVSRASIRYVKASWNRMATSMRRDAKLSGLLAVDPRTGKSVVPFHVSLELQKNGRAHLHVVVRVPTLEHGFAYRGRLRTLAVRAGFGGDAARGRGMGFDMQAARTRNQLASYVTKGGKVEGYVTKAEGLLPRHARRFSWSAAWCDWSPATRIAGLWDWRLAGAGPSTVTRGLVASGIHVLDPGLFRITAAPIGAGG